MNITIKFLELDVLNKNGRIYNKEAAESIIENFDKRINTIGCVYGELGAPEQFDTSLSNCSHTISSIRIEDEKYMVADINILNTKLGKEAIKIIDTLTLSPRSAGFIREGNIVEISRFFTLDLISKEESAYDL